MKKKLLLSLLCIFILSACSSAEENLAKANAYFSGKDGENKDYDQAFKYYTKAAKQGNAEAQTKLAKMYVAGHNKLPNFVTAGDWFQKAADQHYAEAEYHLGLLYFNGQGYTKNFDMAFNWLQKSAIQGNSEAQFLLAYMYEFGQGTEENFALHTEWLNKSIAQNNVTAKNWALLKYLKIGPDGDLLNDNAKEWSCIKDNKTGLLWESKQKKGIHNLNDKFTWAEAFTDKNNFVKRVNAAGLCGQHNWRGAQINELLTLIDTAQKPKINVFYFPYTINFYWSASPNDVDENSAWYINFITGSESTISKLTSTYVLLVHSDNASIETQPIETSLSEPNQ